MAKKGKLNNKNSQEIVERPIRFRKYQQFFLIVCEDEKTEPKYFQQFIELFPEYTMYVRTIGTGNDPLGVVNSSIYERIKLREESRKEIDFVWVVFDKDDADENAAKINRFNLAFEKAEKENINVAYSNEAFELWLLLHLSDVDNTIAIPRQEIYATLETRIKEIYNREYVYTHGDSSVVELIRKIGDEALAIERAQFLLAFHENTPPLKANPSTKIHLLVKELRAWIKYYKWEPE